MMAHGTRVQIPLTVVGEYYFAVCLKVCSFVKCNFSKHFEGSTHIVLVIKYDVYRYYLRSTLNCVY